MVNNLVTRHNDYVVRITLLDPNNFEKYDLYFRLFNIPLASKWAKQFKELKEGAHWFRERKKHSKFGTLDESLVDKFNSLITTINSFYDLKISYISKISENELNILHEAYAVYGQRNKEKLDENYWDTAYKNIPENDPRTLVWPGITFNEEMHEAFLRLNDLIHQTELVLHDVAKPDSGFVALASYNPRTNVDLEDEDLPALKINLDFGDLCLGYNTLGKNLKQIVYDGDRESLEKGLVMPQVNWSNEIIIHMKDSDNHPWAQYDYYNKWKKINPEDFGYQYGDFYKNKEGYYCIGELAFEQKNQIWDPVSRTTKINLERYTDIHSIAVLSNRQATQEFIDSNARWPHWKVPRTLTGKKINKIENTKFSVVTWIMNDICNYSCRYCPPQLHNGQNYKHDNWENISEFIDHTIENLGSADKKVLFSISGGEPTLSPFFPNLVKHIHTLGHHIRVTTNLSRTARYIEDNFQYLLGASCSFHPAFEFKNNTQDEFIKKLEICNKVTNAAVRVMMDPLYWDQTVDFIERLKKETTAYIEIVMIDDQYGGLNYKLLDINYTQDQLDYFANFKPRHNLGHEKGYKRKTYKELDIEDAVVYFEDGSTDSPTQVLINNGQTNFYGYKCDIGKSSMFIKQDGSIRKANCHVGGSKWGTLSEWKAIDWYNFKQPITCTELCCYCGADLPIPKKK